jgi:hypothetical protein
MYTLDDFQSILFKSEAALLPKELTDLLVHLESQLDIVAEGPAAVVQEVRPNHRKAPSYRGGKGHPNNKHNKKEEDWEAVRSFKATKIEVKVGIEKTVNDLRVVLNKMSTANSTSVGLLFVTLARLWIKSPIESTEKHHCNDGDCRYAGDSPYAVIAIDQRVAKVGNLDLHHGKAAV